MNGWVDWNDNVSIKLNSENLYNRSILNINYFVIFNGLIYNKDKLIKEIEEKGLTIKTNFNEEIILLSYIIWKYEFVSKVKGKYSFIIWNDNKKELILFRDKIGCERLFYFKELYKLFFSSKIIDMLNNIKYVNSGIEIMPVRAGYCMICNKQGIYQEGMI